ncbi:PilZ domain-containing protein [Pseudobutyrivibrio sp. OR37]|uniref:PilZ domain-containing protein n=1 Tax=Pseudobutyrivibrio sp. OR37 TaxID=1798186 RepID=UPI0008EE56CB|nr:PilZ domain-containing protein [Pseudobutyrivibrio sp. OR37]SFH57354.1 PilZ domain-containing protein [Pseudobutyrivibrio sp. OR37]
MENKKRLQKIHIVRITKDDTISILATVNDRLLELPLTYAELTVGEKEELIDRYGAQVLAVGNILKMWQDKINEIHVKGKISKLDLIDVNPYGVFKWDNVKINKCVLKTGKLIYVITPKSSEGARYNRRRGVRIKIDKPMTVEQNEKFYTVIVKDISYCGVAIEELGVSKLDTKQEFILHFSETDLDGNDKPVGEFWGRVKTQKNNENGSVVSGCVFSADHASFLQKYIATKQIERMKIAQNKA